MQNTLEGSGAIIHEPDTGASQTDWSRHRMHNSIWEVWGTSDCTHLECLSESRVAGLLLGCMDEMHTLGAPFDSQYCSRPMFSETNIVRY